MIVELHILQNFAPSCLNRDDTNSPKECEFGGCRRARISSQCIKRSIREYFKEYNLLEKENLSVRTLQLVRALTERLVGAGKNADDALKASIEAVKSIGLKIKNEKDGIESKTEYLLFIAEREIEDIANILLEHWDEAQAGVLNSISKEILSRFNGGKASDLALFGRMLANLPAKNIDAACQVAHAISTHKVGVEFDFYTALDDLKKSEEDAGAGMMGTIEFNSACYYRYANIDLRQFTGNLLGKDRGKASTDDLSKAYTLTRRSIEAFIRAAVNAIPTGKQNSFAAQNPPSFVFAVVRDSGTWSLANAFAHPVRAGESGALVQRSIAALLDYWGRLVNAYGEKEIKEKAAFALEECKLGDFDTGNLEGLLARVSNAISEDY